MSEEKTSEKTFKRKNNEDDEGKKHTKIIKLDPIVIALPSQQPKTPIKLRIKIGDKPKTSSIKEAGEDLTIKIGDKPKTSSIKEPGEDPTKEKKKKKKKKKKQEENQEKDETQKQKRIAENGVEEIEGLKKPKKKKESDSSKSKQKLENQEKDETQKQKRVVENGVEEIEDLKKPKKKKPSSKKESDSSKSKKMVKNQEENETQKQKRVDENGVEEIEGLKEPKKKKPTLKIVKNQGIEEKKEAESSKKKKKKKVENQEKNETQKQKRVDENGVEEIEGLKELKKKKPKKKKVENEEKDETQKQKRVVENGVEEIEGLKEPKKKKKKPTSKIQGIEKDGDENKAKQVSSECRFPINRIVRIIKSEGSDYRLSQESVFLINKATEKFIELFSANAYDCAVQEKKSFVGYRHLSSAVGKEKRLDFLSDFVPEKVTAEKALAGRKPAETLQG